MAVIIWGYDPEREALLRRELDRMLARLKERPSVERVIHFGAFSRGEAAPTTDIDLIVVERTEKRFLDRLGELYDYLDPHVSLDLLVYTPQEFEDMSRTRAFVIQAVKSGKVLYEA